MSETTELIAQQILNGNINKRTWGDILYNVKAYGAVGDGAKDDTAAIQAAIDYAISVGGKAIFFPHGTYKVTALTNLTSVILFGDNATFSGITDTINQIGKPPAPPSSLVYNVKDYGAKADGSNDAPAFQAAVNAMTSGGVLFIPPGEYIFKGTGSELLLITKPIIMMGSGDSTKIIIDSSVPNTTDIIRYSPASGKQDTFGYFGKFYIWGSSGTVRYGRDAIVLDVIDPTKHINDFIIDRISVLMLGGQAIRLKNPTGTDGFFTSTIQDCLLDGGINLERSGDSVNILRNTITGPNTGITMTTAAGAAMTIIEANNITAAGGAISITGANQVQIKNNQIEQTLTYTGTVDSNIYLKDCDTCQVIGNNINGTNLVGNNVRLSGNSNNNIVDGNYMFRPINNHVNIDAATVVGTFIGKKGRFYNAGTLELEFPIVNNIGVKTIGVQIPVGFGTGVTAFDTVNFGVPSVKKTENGLMKLYGILNTPTITAGTNIATVPAGYRVLNSTKYISVMTFAGSVAGQGMLQTDNSGAISIASVPAGTTRVILEGAEYAID